MTTQFANASYQEVIDLHTESDRVSIVGIHTPCSDTPYHMLKGFWDQFKKFKYNGCSMSLVPAATLPVDPLQVSYDASEPSIDPRDMLNPIMFHGCHGDDMGAILNSLYSEPVAQDNHQIIETNVSDSIDDNKLLDPGSSIFGAQNMFPVYEALYYKALTDNTWLKAHPQRGFRKNGLHPMIYQVASTVQIANGINSTTIPGKAIVHDDDDGTSSQIASSTMGRGNSVSSNTLYETRGFGRPTVTFASPTLAYENPLGTPGGFLTPRLQRLGWMDTRNVIGVTEKVSATTNVSTGTRTPEETATDLWVTTAKKLVPTLTPKIFMGMLMLPPAYKQTQHFRLILNHSFSFAKFRGASMQYPNYGMVHDAYGYFNFGADTDDSKHGPTPDDGDSKSDIE